MGPYDRDVAYLRELADRLNQAPDADDQRLRFNDLYMTLDRFLRLVASEDPNIPPELQMEAQDKSGTDSARVYEMLAAYAPHFLGADEVRRLKYLTSIRSRVVHQHEDVTPQAVDELLDLTDLLGQNADQLGVTVSGPAQRQVNYKPGLAAAMDPGDLPEDPDAPALGFSKISPQPVAAGGGFQIPSIAGLSPTVMVGGAIAGVVLVVLLVVFIVKPGSSPSATALATRTAVAQSPTSLVAFATPTVITQIGGIEGAAPTATPAPPPPTEPPAEPAPTEAPAPPAASKWTVTAEIGVNMRDAPSTSGNILVVLPNGAALSSASDGATQDADGWTWIHVVTDDGTEGWVITDAIDPAQ